MGCIVHVSTGLVEDGFPMHVAYGAAKAGLHGLTRFMSRELARAGILTNVVMASTPDTTVSSIVAPRDRVVPRAAKRSLLRRVKLSGNSTSRFPIQRATLVASLEGEDHNGRLRHLHRLHGHARRPTSPGPPRRRTGGFVPIAGRHVVVGCRDADPAVAKILRVDHEGHIELQVLPGDVESHRDLLTPA
jgi:Enoyl-(Acyl carrier protein) reductase